MIEIKIEKLINDGRGLGRDADGRVCMVPGVIPGEIVRVRETRFRRGHVDGICDRVLTPAPGRRPPPCQWFGNCGGCQLQHIDDHLQLGFKAGFIRETLVRAGAVSLDELQHIPFDLCPAEHPFEYRQRIRLLCGPEGEVGFRQAGSHRPVVVNHCLIARPQLNQTLGKISSTGVPASLVGLVREIILEESPAAGKVFMTMLCTRRPRPREIAAARDFFAAIKVENSFLAGRDFSRMDIGDGGRELLRLVLPLAEGKVELSVEPGGFCQVNQEQNLKLVNLVLELAGEGKRVLDLFCGAGNFSLPLAAANTVTGFDLQRAAIRAAERNREKNKVCAATRFFRAAAADGLNEMITAGEQFDLVILDPPRSGCREILGGISATGAEEIIYISCDPATLARDLRILRSEYRYLPERIAAVDMFPQTRHVECVVLLRHQ